MYGEFQTIIVKLPEQETSEDVLRLQVVDPELKRARYAGKVVLLNRSSLRRVSDGHAYASVDDILSVEDE